MVPDDAFNVLKHIIGKITYRNYYDKIKIERVLNDGVIPYVLSKYVMTTIGIVTHTDMWMSTGCNNINNCNLLFAYLGKGVFLPVEQSDKNPNISCKQAKKKNTTTMQHWHKRLITMPVLTRRKKFQNLLHGTRSLCKRYFTQWEFYSIPMDKRIKSTKRKQNKCLSQGMH